jgi:hypothetical protein
MDVLKMIAELRAEKAAVEQTLILLEQLARRQGGKRRGRPPLFLSKGPGIRKRKPFSEETKKRMAASQRKRWAAYRKTQKNS